MRTGRTSYRVLENELRKMILNWESYDSPIPSETALAEKYGICRTTVRKGLSQLVDRGLLRKIHGLGTFVIPQEDRVTDKKHPFKIRLIVPDYAGALDKEDFYDRKLISAVAGHAYISGGTLEISKQEMSAERLLWQFRNLKFDGIIWDRPSLRFFDTLKQLNLKRVPLITLSRHIPGITSIFFDYRRSLENAVRFLVKIGCPHIIFCDMKMPHVPIFSERRAYFQNLMKELNPEFAGNCVYEIDRLKMSERVWDRISAEHPGLNAAICACPLLEKILKRLEHSNIVTISYGEADNCNHSNCEWLNFIEEPRQEIGRLAAELLEKQIDGGTTDTEPRFVKGNFLIRQIQ